MQSRFMTLASPLKPELRLNTAPPGPFFLRPWLDRVGLAEDRRRSRCRAGYRVFQGLQERRLVKETNLESFSCRLTPFRLSDDRPSGAEEHLIIRAEGRGGVVEEMVTVKLVD